jgi:tripartite-type tricarboxylate transporter receptor subunit TctC
MNIFNFVKWNQFIDGFDRRNILTTLVLLLIFAIDPGRVNAQDYPVKTVRIISPYSAGSGPDVLSRVIAEQLTKIWSQQVIVDAKPGGNGFIALESVKRGSSEGYDIGLVSNAHMTINPALIKNIPYDSKADFAPVAILYNTTFFIATSVNGPYKSLSQLISFAKANPGRVFYGSPYVGSPSHLGGAYLESLTGTKMVHVPFKDVLQIYTTVATGQVDWALGSYGSMAALVQAGKLKLMAVAGKKRLLSQPDVPTANELLGLKDYEVNSWVAFIAPKNVPDSVVRKINADVNRVLESAETKQTLNQLGFIGAADSVEGLARIIDTDLKINFDLVRKSGITAE